MRKAYLPIGQTLVAAYRDLARVLAGVRAVSISGFLILLAIAVASDLIPNRLWEPQLSGSLLGVAQDLVWAFLLTPVLIAVHRFVILGAATRTYAMDPRERSLLLFFGWLLATKLIAGLPFTLLETLQAMEASLQASAGGFLLALGLAVWLLLRLTILLPAIAVGAPGATPSRALADSKGHVLRLLALFVLALLPWMAAIFGAVILIGPKGTIAGTPAAMLSLAIGAALQTIMALLVAIVASYAFIGLAWRVKLASN